MTAKLPPWISYCEVEDRAIILDVRGNRYFMASGKAMRALTTADPLAAAPNLRGIFQDACNELPNYSTACDPIPAALEHSAETGRMRLVMSLMLSATATIISMRLKLAAFNLDRLLWNAQQRNRACLERKPSRNLGDLISAFECAERLIVERDKCLLRSLALQDFLATHGHVSALVFGVRLHPFRAHCWLQHGSTVLNDTIEVIGSFRPLRTVL